MKLKIDITIGNGAKVQLSKEQNTELEAFVGKLLGAERKVREPKQPKVKSSKRKKGTKPLGSRRWTPEERNTLKETVLKASADDSPLSIAKPLAPKFMRTPIAIAVEISRIRKEHGAN